MICPRCCQAGMLNSIREHAHAIAMHLECESVDCPCQHKTGAGWHK